MEGQNLLPPQVDASRPSLDFPVGTALLLVIIFTLNDVFSCCYHWDNKFRSFRQFQFPSSPTKSNLNIISIYIHYHYSPFSPVSLSLTLCLFCFFSRQESKKQNREESLPVLMPERTRFPSSLR
ncbi:hypothetical protein Ahy_A03g011225 isoform B [Arachis hypogaea]|uniref:Uncharacterized protein n=1 Tax=Arachis hypogaea TaxID=3818 RepID=A0A445DQ67_ARAHY|nr:hypothetical protein Ahy_A03g011225 isoform B [Arachis hypogaea]